MSTVTNGIRAYLAGADWAGRSGRGLFLAATLFVVAAVVAAQLLPPFHSVGFVVYPVVAATTFLHIGHIRRRLRDIDASGWWLWLYLIPLANLVLLAVLLLRRARGDRSGGVSRLGYGLTILLGLFLASRALWHPFTIPSGSMKPTLMVSDYLMATRIGASVQRGDVIVFTHPANGQTFIARVIGMGGDTLTMVDGVPVLNGTPLDQVSQGKMTEVMAPQGPLQLVPRCSNAPVALGGVCEKEVVTETLPSGRFYQVLNIDRQGSDNTPVYTVPAGEVFVMGDNRDNSNDSRIPAVVGGVGMVPQANILGRAWLVALNTARFDRWMERVR